MRHLAILLTMALVVISCDQGPSETQIDKIVTDKINEMESVEEANKNAILNLLQSFGTGDDSEIDQYIHPDFTNHHAPEGLQDRDGFHQIVKQVSDIFSQFESLDLKPVHLFAKGDYVAMMDAGTGVKNGKEYKHVDIHIFKMKDNKMHEHWNSFPLTSQQDILMNFIEETN